MKKPYYRSKGKYSDGRQRIVIEWAENGKKVSRALPKPEKLLDTLNCPKNTKENKEKNGH